MSLTITTDTPQVITDATGSAGVVYLSGVSGGAKVYLDVLMSNAVPVKLLRSYLQEGANVVTHGAGATLRAVAEGSTATTNLTLDFHVI